MEAPGSAHGDHGLDPPRPRLLLGWQTPPIPEHKPDRVRGLQLDRIWRSIRAKCVRGPTLRAENQPSTRMTTNMFFKNSPLFTPKLSTSRQLLFPYARPAAAYSLSGHQGRFIRQHSSVSWDTPGSRAASGSIHAKIWSEALRTGPLIQPF